MIFNAFERETERERAIYFYGARRIFSNHMCTIICIGKLEGEREGPLPLGFSKIKETVNFAAIFMQQHCLKWLEIHVGEEWVRGDLRGKREEIYWGKSPVAITIAPTSETHMGI